MNLRSFKINPRDVKAQRVEGRPFLRVSRMGCDLANCRCSGDRFVSLSDGKQGVVAQLTNDEYEALRQHFATGSRVELFGETKR